MPTTDSATPQTVVDAAQEVPATGQDAVKKLVEQGALDGFFAHIDSGGVQLTGQNGFFSALIKAGLERGLQAELTRHLGYDKGDPQASAYPNSRNGTSAKTLASHVGDIDVQIPRDRAGTFTPMLVPKGSRRLGGLDEMIISLYAGGMTIRDIQHHLVQTVGSELSHETISKITDEMLDEVKAWQNRPLESFYPIVYLDALVVKIRDGHHVINKACHMAIGVDMEGVKHVLGLWIQQAEGAKFWAGVCAELANRGVKDVLIVCCDGLAGFPEAIGVTWPKATVQTCTVHLIRASMRFVGYQHRKALAAALRPIYTAPSIDAAKAAFEEFKASELGKRYPTAVATWESAWERFIPFLAFPPEVRKIIYTTNAIESMNYQLRKIIKNRGHFPSDDAAVKLLWLAICNIEDKRARERAKKKKGGTNGNHVLEGAQTAGWPQALGALSLIYPERINQHL